MAINPEDISTTRVDQLGDAPLSLESKIPHQPNTTLKKATVQELVDFVAAAIGVSAGVGYLPLAVTDGQQLPDVPTTPSFFLCGAGTYLNINGYPDVVCTASLNAVMSLSDHWQLAVEIPISPLSGTVQSVTGAIVDNTDPLNPVVNTPTLQQILNYNHELVDDNNFQGSEAGIENEGIFVLGFGNTSAYQNTGDNVNAIGTESAAANTGDFVNAIGAGSATQNGGDFVNAIGINNATRNTGNYVNAVGYDSLIDNTGSHVNAFGQKAGNSNAFKNVNLFGFQATADADNQNVFSKWISDTLRYLAKLSFNNITADRKWELQDKDGIISHLEDVYGLKPIIVSDPSGVYFTDLASARVQMGYFGFPAPLSDLFLNGKYYMWYSSLDIQTIAVSLNTDTGNAFGFNNDVTIQDESGFIYEMAGDVFRDNTSGEQIILKTCVFNDDDAGGGCQAPFKMTGTAYINGASFFIFSPNEISIDTAYITGATAFSTRFDIVGITSNKVSIKNLMSIGTNFCEKPKGRYDIGYCDSGIDFSVDSFSGGGELAWVHAPLTMNILTPQGSDIKNKLTAVNGYNQVIYD